MKRKGRKTELVRLNILNRKGPIQVYLNRAYSVGNDLLYRVEARSQTVICSSVGHPVKKAPRPGDGEKEGEDVQGGPGQDVREDAVYPVKKDC